MTDFRFLCKAGIYSVPLFLLLGCAKLVASHPNPAIRPALIQDSSDAARAARRANAERIFVRGLTRAHSGNHAQAISFFRESLRLYPNQAAVMSALVDSYRETKDYKRAVQYASRSIELAPDNPHYYEQLADVHLLTESYKAGIATLRTLLRRSPENHAARLKLAEMQAASGAFREALNTFHEAIELSGDDPQLRYRMMQIYVTLGDDEGVTASLERMVAMEPENPELLRSLGEYHLQRGDLERAVALLERALQQDPNDFETAFMLAELYLEQGEIEKADALLDISTDDDGLTPSELMARAGPLYARSTVDENAGLTSRQMLERVIEQQPDNPDALFMLGDLNYRGGDFAKAANLLRRGVEHNPRNLQAWIQAGAAYLQADEPKKSLEVVEEAMLLFPDQFPLVRIAAYSAVAAYENRQAIRYLGQALKVIEGEVPDDVHTIADLHASLGLVHNRMGSASLADESYAAAIEANPNHSMALNNYAYSLAVRNESLDNALEMARRAVELEPDNSSFLDTIGWVYYQMGRLEEALEWIGKSISTGNASAAVYEHYGDVCRDLGKEDEAIQYWGQALKMSPENADLRQKIDRINSSP